MTNETIYIYLENQKTITSRLEIDFIKNKKELWAAIPTKLYEISSLLSFQPNSSLRSFLYKMDPCMLLSLKESTLDDSTLNEFIALSTVFILRPYKSIQKILDFETIYVIFFEYSADCIIHIACYSTTLFHLRHFIFTHLNKPILVMDIDRTIITTFDDIEHESTQRVNDVVNDVVNGVVNEVNYFIKHGTIEGKIPPMTFKYDVMFRPDCLEFFYKVIGKVDLFFISAGNLTYAREIINLLENKLHERYPELMFDTLSDHVISVRKSINEVKMKSFRQVIPFLFITYYNVKYFAIDDKKYVWCKEDQNHVFEIAPFMPSSNSNDLLDAFNKLESSGFFT